MAQAAPLPRLRRMLALAAVLAASIACTPRQAPPDSTGPGAPATPAAPAPDAAVQPATPPPTDVERDAVLFKHWRDQRAADVEAFEEFLVREQVAQVVPSYQLLRSASMWKECHSEPFQLPPAPNWVEVRDLLLLLRELQRQHVLPPFEVVSAYRDPRLNRCAGGAPGSAHVRFAVDIAPLSLQAAEDLCRFWREQGQAWDMGVSRYPSGRIHIDRTGYRTWGASHRRGSSDCVE